MYGDVNMYAHVERHKQDWQKIEIFWNLQRRRRGALNGVWRNWKGFMCKERILRKGAWTVYTRWSISSQLPFGVSVCSCSVCSCVSEYVCMHWLTTKENGCACSCSLSLSWVRMSFICLCMRKHVYVCPCGWALMCGFSDNEAGEKDWLFLSLSAIGRNARSWSPASIGMDGSSCYCKILGNKNLKCHTW